MSQGRAVESKNKAKKFYQNGIIAFVGIFTLITVCLWFLSSINF
jgi:hypothetical protein